MAERGLFIVIEGSDGAGKSTQFKLLQERLKSAKYDIHTIKFPRYDHESSLMVRKYLKGEYGTAKEVGPYKASMFYAMDRFDAKDEIQEAIDSGKIVLVDRYVGSNMAHQATFFDTEAERKGFYTWVDQYEFDTLGVPRPDLNIVLTLPFDVTIKRIAKRKEKKDLLEADDNHVRNSIRVYQEICDLFPKSFSHVDCIKKGNELSPAAVSNKIWEKLEPMLKDTKKAPLKKTSKKNDKKKSKKPNNPFVKKNSNGSYSVTDRGEAYLKDAVTNTKGNVYVFTDKLSNVTVAAAMARLSRRGDDMRITLLDEFAEKEGKDEGLLKRVITAYGDDSVQQLAGIHLVVENASNILTKKLEWGRLAAYLEQSTRYIYFDQPDEKGNFKYFTPKNLTAPLAKEYELIMDAVFRNYSELVRELTKYVRNKSNTPAKEQDIAWKGATRAQACDAARPCLPTATKATVGIFASGQALESLIMHLLWDDLDECRDVGQSMLEEARKMVPVFLERADKPDRGGATVAYHANTRKEMQKLADEHLPQNLSPETEEVNLVDHWPKNEMDLLPHILYEYSNLSLDDIEKEVSTWPYEQKLKVLRAYMGDRLNRRHKPGRGVEYAHYSFDLVCDYGIFRDLQRHRIVDELQWQELSPRHGYEVPTLVEEADLTELYEKCFDLSYELYSKMQKEGFHLEAQYATLLGHKMRWKVTYNAREAFHLHELRTTPQGHPGYRRLVKMMHDKVAEVHPITADSMSFVNKGEDAELTRLAAEKYTQYKLQQLDKVNKK